MQHERNAQLDAPSGYMRDMRAGDMIRAPGSISSLRDQPCPSGLEGIHHRVRVVGEHLSALHAIADRACGEMPPREGVNNRAAPPAANGMLEHIESELDQLISNAEALVDRFRKLD